ncbi:MAG TPA: biopolymer transporter ExbD [Candidatus Ozemobacteraceae bacterium]|nr:biopolymer transporter ExbD [Candidatus Ozemobacteraceae bacterium]
MSLRRRAQKSEPFLDMTPCSDIMFTLLLFYILTQSFVTQMPVQLPRLATGESVVDARQIRLQIERDGQVVCQSAFSSVPPSTARRSASECRLEPPWERSLPRVLPASDPAVLVVVHREAPAGIAVELLDALRRLGVPSISFAGLPRTESIE